MRRADIWKEPDMILKAINRVRNREEGFTLIELLVVVIIIGILAAIAIPVFLNQRKKGWESAVKSDLRNYAIVLETHLTDAGAYNATTPPLPAPVESTGVNVTVPTGTFNSADTYCLQGVHDKNVTDIWSLKPGGALVKAACS